MVQECYGQLLAEGYLTSRTGSATRVAGISGQQAGGLPMASLAPVSPAPTPTPPRPLQEPPLIADFQLGVPDLSSFPRTDWAWAIKQANTWAATATWTATRVAASNCARCWPVTCGEYGQPPPARRR